MCAQSGGEFIAEQLIGLPCGYAVQSAYIQTMQAVCYMVIKVSNHGEYPLRQIGETAVRKSGLLARKTRHALLSGTLALVIGVSHADDTEIFAPESCDKFRFIFIVDNSGSMSTTEFNQSKSTIDSVITEVLDSDLGDVQAAVVQYGSNNEGSVHTYNVTVPFTDDIDEALDWRRAYGRNGNVNRDYYQDHQPASLASMRRDNVYDPGGALDITEGTNVQFVFFTDAWRDASKSFGACCSSIVTDSYSHVPNTVASGFDEYNLIKNGSVLPGGIEGQFTLLHVSPDDESKRAGAAIASVGGEYFGPIEANSNDPDGSQKLPRRYVEGSLESSDTDLILSVIRDVIDEIGSDVTFSAPTVSLDNYSRLFHRDDVYFALFSPKLRDLWKGNLKRYRFAGDPPRIVDVNDVDAISSETGSFAEGVQSYWSTSPDGPVVEAGGAASKQIISTRWLATYTNTVDEIMDERNRLHESNNRINWQKLGLSDNSTRTDLLRWLRGVDIYDEDKDNQTDDARRRLGDPIHSKPVLVNYKPSAGDPDEINTVVYFGTNEGFLHAVDAVDGSEIFAYMPRFLLDNLPRVLHDIATGTDHPKPYGVDGELSTWINDTDQNGYVEAEAGDHAYLYVGLRRGGRGYGAFDVSEKYNPKRLWAISSDTSGFGELGQSWSRAVVTSIRFQGNVRKVLVISGGYDPQQDDTTTRTPDTMGRAMFIVDAENGSLIWKGSPGADATRVFPNMHYSIPATPLIIDLNDDGVMDQIYVGDMGGQVWRFDVNQDADLAMDLIDGGVIANLAGDDAENNRRFYNTPDVAHIPNNDDSFLAVSIGSGFRAHPLDTTIKDRFYMIRQEHVTGKPAGYGMYDDKVVPAVYRPVREGDLFDATDNAIGEGTAQEQSDARDELNESEGWRLSLLTTGEKVLTPSLTANNQVVFTSYLPKPRPEGTCAPAIGGGRVYVLNILDGTPVLNLYGGDNDNLTKEDRYIELSQSGIPSQPYAFFPEDEDPVLMIGREKGPDIDFGVLLLRSSWYEHPDI